jgi:hypothetical protein
LTDLFGSDGGGGRMVVVLVFCIGCGLILVLVFDVL